MIDEIIKKLEHRIKIARGENYIISNLSNDVIKSEMRGWVCGHFYPKGSVFHRHDIEICFKTMPLNHREKLHHHLCTFEFLLILSGKIEYEIGGDKHVLTPGMFYMLEPGCTERIVKVCKKTTVLAVRLPSVKDNQVFIRREKKKCGKKRK